MRGGWRQPSGDAKNYREGGEIRCKPRLLLVFNLNWYSHRSYTDEYDIYGYIEHYARKPERWLVHYFPMDARGLEATYHHQVGSGGRPLHEGEKCGPRDTAKDAAKYLLDLADHYPTTRGCRSHSARFRSAVLWFLVFSLSGLGD
jgi:hypothetical protein